MEIDDSLNLTEREAKAIELALRGYTLQMTARVMKCSRQDVKNYRRYAYDKLGCSSTLELWRMATDQQAVELFLCDDITWRPELYFTESDLAAEIAAQAKRRRHRALAARIKKEYEA